MKFILLVPFLLSCSKVRQDSKPSEAGRYTYRILLAEPAGDPRQILKRTADVEDILDAEGIKSQMESGAGLIDYEIPQDLDPETVQRIQRLGPKDEVIIQRLDARLRK